MPNCFKLSWNKIFWNTRTYLLVYSVFFEIQGLFFLVTQYWHMMPSLAWKEKTQYLITIHQKIEKPEWSLTNPSTRASCANSQKYKPKEIINKPESLSPQSQALGHQVPKPGHHMPVLSEGLTGFWKLNDFVQLFQISLVLNKVITLTKTDYSHIFVVFVQICSFIADFSNFCIQNKKWFSKSCKFLVVYDQ